MAIVKDKRGFNVISVGVDEDSAGTSLGSMIFGGLRPIGLGLGFRVQAYRLTLRAG